MSTRVEVEFVFSERASGFQRYDLRGDVKTLHSGVARPGREPGARFHACRDGFGRISLPYVNPRPMKIL